MNSITFEIEDCVITLAGTRVLIWKERADHEPDIDLDIKALTNALSTAHMLVKPDNQGKD